MKTILSKCPIDFTFNGYDNEGKFKVLVGNNRGKARQLKKETPYIYYYKNFDRDAYEKKRKRMLNLNQYEIVDQAEFRIRLTKFPNCFLLVDLSRDRSEWFRTSFPGCPKILEFIQIKPLTDGNAHEPTFKWEEDDWFEINETDKFYPETGMLLFNGHQEMIIRL